MLWNPGDTVAFRGMYQNHPWYIQSAIVVKDSHEETALAMIPGAECVAPYGYIHQKHGLEGKWERWDEMRTHPWQLEKYIWHTNRFLILLKPDAFYATMLIWQDATNTFKCYYINFQLPFKRSHCGFDTLDLELDIIIKPDNSWHWKDVEEYKHGIEAGLLLPDWTQGIKAAQPEVFEMIERRQYPLDGYWLNWKPDPAWVAPKLPANWDR